MLGALGSGCTIFLMFIANECGTYTNVTGDAQYPGISHSEILKCYKDEVVYNQEGENNVVAHENNLSDICTKPLQYPITRTWQRVEDQKDEIR